VFRPCDIPALFADSPDEAEYGGESARVLFDQHDEEILQGHAQSTAYRMTYAATVFAQLRRGDALTVNGEDFMVQNVRLLDDGALKVAILYRP
jgi:hypothetical protein